MHYFESLHPPELRAIGEAIHERILELLPEAEVAIKYKIPFYVYFGNLCYLNKGKDHLYLGFLRGKELTDENNLLVAGDRKLVRILLLPDLASVRSEATASLLLEAAWLNQEYGRNV